MGSKRYITDYENLMKEWDWDLNEADGFDPKVIAAGSEKKIHWICEKGHKWQAIPNNRSKGQGCPICAGKKILIGYNDLTTVAPHVIPEWNNEKNAPLKPEDVTKGSNKKVWWKCTNCGHEWKCTVANRISGKGCPACSKKKQGENKIQNIILKVGSLADNYPDILIDWNYDKNEVPPEKLTASTHKKVWWKCHTCNYEWEAPVAHRTVRGHKCPACMNKVAAESNCLRNTHPEILDKWNYEQNKTITPDDVTFGSNKKVWWKCEKGHEWQATVSAIVNGGKCPVCIGQKVLKGYNDLATVRPDLAAEWHPSKNGDYTPEQVTAGSSRKKVWWLCPKGHEYQATVTNRNNGTGCPVCSKESKTSFPEQAIYYYLSKITHAENRFLYDGKTEIDIYLPEYKIGIEYDGFYYHKGAKAKQKEIRKDEMLKAAGIHVIRVKEVKNDVPVDMDNVIFCRNNGQRVFIEEVLHKLIKRIQRLTSLELTTDIDVLRDSSEIYSQYINSEKENSFAAKNPDLAKEWHPLKNGNLTPELVSFSSAKKVWWLGGCGHEWQSSVDNRNRGNGCPICAGFKLLKGYNDLATTHRELLNEWSYEKNSISPEEITIGQHKKVWWKCENGHEYQATPSNKAMGRGCPYCSNKKILKGYNDLKSQYPDVAADWNYEKNTILPEDIAAGSNKMVWWKCSSCGHEWKQQPNHRVFKNTGCPACSGRVATESDNLLIVNPELCKEWDWNKNSISPENYRPNSNKKVWWICDTCGYGWKASISDRNIGTGCPACAGKHVVKGYNDFATKHPELLDEWYYDKNKEIRPDQIVSGTHKKVWWKCRTCGHDWEASIANRSKGRGCPKCARKRLSARKEEI